MPRKGGTPIKPIRAAACLALLVTLVVPAPPAAQTAPRTSLVAADPDTVSQHQVDQVEPPDPEPGSFPSPAHAAGSLETPAVQAAPSTVQVAAEVAAEDGSATATPAVASWFGPGLYGNRTACGRTLTTELLGVAHRTLPCGSPVTMRYAGTTVTVPVVDRGPHIPSREFDLTYATKVRLGCSDLCKLEWLR